MAEQEMIEKVYFTTAPEAYDYSTVKETLETFELNNKTWRKIRLVETSYRIEYQINRYGSGCNATREEDPRIEAARWEREEQEWREKVAAQEAHIDTYVTAEDLRRYLNSYPYLEYKAQSYAKKRLEELETEAMRAHQESLAQEKQAALPYLPSLLFFATWKAHTDCYRFTGFHMVRVHGFNHENMLMTDSHIELSAKQILEGDFENLIPWYGNLPPSRLFQDHLSQFDKWEVVHFEGETYYRVPANVYSYYPEFCVYTSEGSKVRKSKKRKDLFAASDLPWEKVFNLTIPAPPSMTDY